MVERLIKLAKRDFPCRSLYDLLCQLRLAGFQKIPGKFDYKIRLFTAHPSPAVLYIMPRDPDLDS
jgi:hypothetical protein